MYADLSTLTLKGTIMTKTITPQLLRSSLGVWDATPKDKEVGYPYVVFIPLSYLNDLPGSLGQSLRISKATVTKEQPLFLRTDVKFCRIRFKNGDAESAISFHDQVKALHKEYVFKNWI